jgi:hypothetical protein
VFFQQLSTTLKRDWIRALLVISGLEELEAGLIPGLIRRHLTIKISGTEN